jgi:hypothetical protein
MRNLLMKAHVWMDANPAAGPMLWLGLDCACVALGWPLFHG